MFNLVSDICNILGKPDIVQNITEIKRIRSFDNKVNKPIIVTFSNLKARNNFLFASKRCGQSNLLHLNLCGIKTRFFVNEHLTAKKKELLYLLRNHREVLQIRALIVKTGRIFVKLGESSKIIEVTAPEQITKLLPITNN